MLIFALTLAVSLPVDAKPDAPAAEPAAKPAVILVRDLDKTICRDDLNGRQSYLIICKTGREWLAEPVSATAADTTPAATPAAASPVVVRTLASVSTAATASNLEKDSDALVCHIDLKTGSRLNYVKACMTVREWNQLQHGQATYLDMTTALKHIP